MRYEDFLREFSRGQSAPVYFFFGEEDYLIEEATKRILSQFVDPSTADFNLDIFHGDEVSGAQLVNAALSYPVMASYRVVVVKRIEGLSSEARGMLLRYCERPSPQTKLVLTAGKIDTERKFYRDLMARSQWVEFRPLYENKVALWIRDFVWQRRKEISPRAIQLLQAKLGHSLRDIANELEKLLLFTRDKNRIEAKDVEVVVGISKSFNIFELWDAIGERHLIESFKIAQMMIESGESAVFMVSMLTTYFVRLWKVRILRAQGMKPEAIASELNINPFFLDRTLRQAQRYPEKKIRQNLEHLLKADVALKSGYQTPRLVMDLLIYQLVKD